MLNLAYYRKASSLYIEKSHQDCYVERGEVIRDWFSNADFVAIDPYPRHTHGESAAKRSVGSNFIDLLADLTASRQIRVQGSMADVRQGRPVTREWFWAKDLTMPQVSIDVRPGLMDRTLFAYVDVDEYIDMPQELAVNFAPHILYTLVPSRAGKVDGEYSYRFLKDGSVEYVVAGGGKYVHHVWDYSSDNLRAEGSEWLWLSDGTLLPVLVKYTAFYKVERKNVDDDHQVVLLSPLRRWSQVLPYGDAWLATKLVAGTPLVRFNPVVGDFVRVERKTREGLFVSTARVGDFSCAYTSVSVDEEVAIKSALCKDALSVAMTKTSIAASGSETMFGAEVVTAFHRANPGRTISRVFTTDEWVRSYQFLPKLANYDPGAKPSMKCFMAPLVHGGFSPAMCESNDRRAVEKRVLEVKTSVKLSPFLLRAMRAFVDNVASAVIVPVDEDEVRKRQSRPTQRAIIERSQFESTPGVAMCFVKRQAETKIGDPRIITTINGSDKVDYSSFMYSLYDLLKQLPWFASGMKPKEVAERVAAVATGGTWLAETDFSRMDGRISEAARHLEWLLMSSVFAPSMHKRIRELMRRQTMLRCSTKFGVHYNSGLARGSGSPETSVFNTLLTGFVMFLAYCLGGRNYDEAWKQVCDKAACQGDDGIAADMHEQEAVRAANMVGQKLTIQLRGRGETVSFLARHYGPDVWFGDTDSCCDLARQLSKFHLATYVEDDDSKRLLKLREKAFAYWLTDEHTPVLGDFVSKVLELGPVTHAVPGTDVATAEKDGTHVYRNLHGIWNSEIASSDQYPSKPDHHGWKLALLEHQLPDFAVGRFITWVQSCTSLSELMVPPPPVVIEATHPGGGGSVVVDDDVLADAGDKKPARPTPRGRRGGSRQPTERGAARGPKPRIENAGKRYSARPKPGKPGPQSTRGKQTKNA